MNKYLLLIFISISLVGCGASSSSNDGSPIEGDSPNNEEREPVTIASPIIEGLSQYMGPESSPEIAEKSIESEEMIELNTKVTGELDFLSELEGSFIELSFSYPDGELVAFFLSGATDTAELAIYSNELLGPDGYNNFYIAGSMDKELVFYAEPGINYTVDIYDDNASGRVDFSLTASKASRSTLSLTTGQFYVKTAIATTITLCDGEPEARSNYREYYEIWDFLDNSMIYGNESTYNEFDSIIDNVVTVSGTDTEENSYGNTINSWVRHVTISPMDNEFHGTFASNETTTKVDNSIKACFSTGTIEGSVVL